MLVVWALGHDGCIVGRWDGGRKGWKKGGRLGTREGMRDGREGRRHEQECVETTKV
jgi:hypothetical protein